MKTKNIGTLSKNEERDLEERKGGSLMLGWLRHSRKGRKEGDGIVSNAVDTMTSYGRTKNIQNVIVMRGENNPPFCLHIQNGPRER